MSIQFWEPTSNVLITNQSAFPLNVGLDRVAPLQHTNSLQPGESWVTYPPPYFPIPESNLAKRILSLPISILHVTILSLSSTKWINRAYLTASTKIDVRFDHEHNRFRPSAARHLWLSVVIRWLCISALTTSVALLITQICRRPSIFLQSEFFLHLQWSIGTFCILSLVFFVSSAYTSSSHAQNTGYFLTTSTFLQSCCKPSIDWAQIKAKAQYCTFLFLYEPCSLRILLICSHRLQSWHQYTRSAFQ